MSNLAFFAADTLGMTLYQVQDHLKSSEMRPIRLGPWQIDLKVSVVSDLINPRYLTFWVTLGRLPFYLLVRDKESWLVALDPELLKLCGVDVLLSETLAERMDGIEPAIKQMFYWQGKQWVRQSMGVKTQRWWR